MSRDRQHAGYWVIRSKDGVETPRVYFSGFMQFSSDIDDAILYETEEMAAGDIATWPAEDRERFEPGHIMSLAPDDLPPASRPSGAGHADGAGS